MTRGMSPSITARAFEILSRRGWHILACSFATAFVVMSVLMAVAVPTFLKQKENAQRQANQPSWVDPGRVQPYGATPGGGAIPQDPRVDPDAGQDMEGGFEGQRVSHEVGARPPTGSPCVAQPCQRPAPAPMSKNALMIVFAIYGVVGLLWLASFHCGVFAACGHGIGASYLGGLRTFPKLLTQALRLMLFPVAVGTGLSLVVSAVGGAGGAAALPLFILNMIVQFGLLAHLCARISVASAGIANGHENWSAAVTLQRIGSNGKRLTGTMLGVWIICWVPILGMVYMQAAAAAMWDKLEDDGGFAPTGGSSPTGSSTTYVEAQVVAPQPVTVAANPAALAAAASAALAAAPAAVAAVRTPAVATVAAGPMVPGPSWYAHATPQAAAGEWVYLSLPGRVALQVQWTVGDAPSVQLADESGAWRTPPQHPLQSGAASWIDLPAGYTWVALVPCVANQELWISSWVPNPAHDAGTSLAA